MNSDLLNIPFLKKSSTKISDPPGSSPSVETDRRLHPKYDTVALYRLFVFLFICTCFFVLSSPSE